MSDVYNVSRPSTPQYRDGWDRAFAQGGVVPYTKPVLVGETVTDCIIPRAVADKLKAAATSESRFFHLCTGACAACKIQGCPSNDI